MEHEKSICDSCSRCDNDKDKKPCCVCMQVIDGYLEATQYDPKRAD